MIATQASQQQKNSLSHQRGSLTSFGLVLAASLGVAPLSPAFAADWTWTVGAGATYSDNQLRAPSDKQSGTTADALFIMDGSQKGPRLDATVAANVVYGYRFRESKSDLVGGVDGSFVYRPLPDYLHFSVDESFGQIRRSFDVADSAENRINFNVLTAGPDIFVPFGKRSRLDLSGRWSRSYYESLPGNNTRKTAGASFIYDLTSFSSLLLSASNSHVDYDDLDSGAAYNIEEASLGYRRKTTRTTIDLSGGKTRVKYNNDQLGDRPARSLARALISHSFTDRVSLTFSAGTNYSDAGSSFVLDQTLIGVNQGTLSGPLSTDAFKLDYADLSIRLTGVRMTILAGIDWNRSRHEATTSLNNDQKSARLTVSRRASQRFDVRFTGSYDRREFVQIDDTFSDESLGVGLTWRLSNKISIDFDVVHEEGTRTGVLASAVPYDFKENHASLRFMYSPTRR